MRRREFLSALAGGLVMPLTARAQPTGHVRSIGVLLNLSENDPETRTRLAVFLRELEKLGWSEGRDLRLDYRWSLGDAERIRKNVAEIIASRPDVILAHGSTIVGPLQRATREIPIVFVSVADPIMDRRNFGSSRYMVSKQGKERQAVEFRAQTNVLSQSRTPDAGSSQDRNSYHSFRMGGIGSTVSRRKIGTRIAATQSM